MAVLNREDYKTAIPQLSKALTELREKVNNISYDITNSLKLYSISSERGYSKTIWVDLKGIPWDVSDYNVDGLDSSSSDELWVKSAIKAICARHPHEKETIFRCSFAPNSRGMLEVFIYDTDTFYGGLPVCFGTFRKFPTLVYSFSHTSSDVWTWHDIDALATGAVPSTRKVNNKALSSDITLTASDVGAVPTSRTVNSKALSSDISLTASDVGAIPDSPKSSIFATRVTNTYCSQAAVERISLMRPSKYIGILRFNLTLDSASMPTGTANVHIGTISGIALAGDVVFSVAPQVDGRGTLIVSVNQSGQIKISNYSGVANSGFYRALVPLYLTT